jgi:hypothetical protein
MQQNYEVPFAFGHAWFGTPPQSWHYQATTFHEHTFPQTKAVLREPYSVCLRVSIRTEPLNFGILGALFVPDKAGQLTLRVGILNVDENKVAGITAGLPEEYAQAVFEEALLAIADTLYLGSGVLTFSYAAWTLVDSSRRTFQVLARSVVQLLNPLLGQVTEQFLNQLVLDNWQQTRFASHT